ncbi:hypothetical protein CRI77_08515 [Mycolicibacterium duvalii]|uniref:Uncharacterized protein n=1 Tax=Mycolicibacterium duvalii TaxID=39688 RepID=A0A7I7K4I4_9MYCO|nr:hypothetical protein [Mycolicibacterium duvalii]MCV7367931.1 hypothetical protein [Mycolicibacterium duvalii]PEG42609.1 hypothetical protein CRI77_08515 [Mycolicibacterium duvalii]BBX18478.1 hypothetical protein MDUV_33380 [Mycolicibacterium duvalii]
MAIDRLRSFVDAPGPFVSLYIDDDRAHPDGAKQAVARWRAIRRHLEDSAVSEHVVGAVERAVLNSPPGVGRAGRAVIAGREGVLLNEHLAAPPSITALRVSEYPYLLPLLESALAHPPYLFAAVDHLGADLADHRNGAVHRETVHGPGFPVHKPATAGWHGYQDFAHTTEEAVRTNARAVAERITELVDRGGSELVFLRGEVGARSDVESCLPRRIQERVVTLPAAASGGRGGEEEMAHQVGDELTRRRREADSAVLARLDAETGRGSGLAAVGLAEVCAALRCGAVDTLVVGDVGSATVVCGRDRTTIAPDAETLSGLGEPPIRVALEDEAVPFVAIATDADIVRVDQTRDLTDGLAALLRYPVGSGADRRSASGAGTGAGSR